KQQKTMQELQQECDLSGGSDIYLGGLYEDYLKEPGQVAEEWRDYFRQMAQSSSDISHADVRQHIAQFVKQPAQPRVVNHGGVDIAYKHKQEKVIDLIFAYRNLGHLHATLDPLGIYKGSYNPTLDLQYYNFTEADMNTVF